MSLKKIKRKERGELEVDFATGLILFMIGSVAIITMYVNIYTMVVRLKANEVAIGYITEICEEIDAESYDQVINNNTSTKSTARLTQIINSCVKETDLYTITPTIVKYNETNTAANDVVAKVGLNIKYKIGNQQMDYTINKIKVKEK